MAYTNSSLATYTNISPNKNANRNHIIDTITIHCVVAQWTAKQTCDYFKSSSVKASCNYAVGCDGSIGLCVEEKDRSWCSSSSANDHRAVTIEVASDKTEPYAVTEKAYNALIELVTDVCKRNGIKKLVWSTNKEDRVNHKNGCNMTVHRDYANKSCPGTYLYNRHGEIAEKVNAKLNASAASNTSTSVLKVGSLVKIIGTKYYGGASIPAWVKEKNWYVYSVSGDRVVIHKSEDGKNAIMSPVKISDLALVSASAAETYRVHTVVKGDTLWDIAVKYLGSGSRYTAIVKLNGLTSTTIYSGQKLKIPNN